MSKRVLIADSEAEVRESLKYGLSAKGYEVDIAEDGEQALEIAVKKEFNVAVLALELPRKEGIQVLKEIRKQAPALQVIIITAHPSAETALEAAKLGAIDYVIKPPALATLEWLIKEALSKPAIAPKEFLPPCQIACPIHEDIQRTNALISFLPQDLEQAKERIIQIGDYLYEKNPLFTVCGYICGLCERECNYKTKGGAIRRRLLKRFLSDTYIPYLPEKKPLNIGNNKEKVGVIGGGPAGLMCAWELRKRGYNVTIFDSSSKLGGALRFIPRYRLPEDIIDITIDNLVRIGGINVEKSTKLDADSFLKLKEKGYKAFFIATGTPYPRPLTFGKEKVEGQDLEGVMYGLTLLSEVNKGNVPSDYFRRSKVIVIGGGNVAFDVARTARRLMGEVTIVCLENEDKTSKDGIPADIEEIEGAYQEGIRIVYTRGVRKILGKEGRFWKIDCPKCISVWDEKGFFNPQFDISDCIELEGDFLLITIGQMMDRTFLQNAGLIDQYGSLAVDPLTLQSLIREDIFIGGDVRKIGFAANAMADGIRAAESIDRYLRGIDLKRETISYEACKAPKRRTYKPQPELKWIFPEERMNFNMFEKGFTLEEAVKEARRCLACGPCVSCKACVSIGIRSALPVIKIREEVCSGCGICVSVCNYGAAQVKKWNDKFISVTDLPKCKACGMCVSACPAYARRLTNGYKEVVKIQEPKVVCFACKFGWGYLSQLPVDNFIPVICLGEVSATSILNAFKEGADGILLLGCPEGDCHFQDGDLEVKKKVSLLLRVLEAFGIEKERVEIISSFDPRGEKVIELINGMVSKLKNLELLKNRGDKL